MTIKTLLTLCVVGWLAVFSAAFVQLGPSGSSALTYTTAIRTSDAVQNNNATPVNDDTLLFAISGNSGDLYVFDAYLEYQASTTADILFNFALPAGASGNAIVYKVASAGTVCGTAASQEDVQPISGSSRPGGVGVATSCMTIWKGYVLSGGTAGNVNLRWSQAVAEVSNVTLKTGSYVNYRKAN